MSYIRKYFNGKEFFYRHRRQLKAMYYIRKYSNGWAIHNDDNGFARMLTDQEIESAKREFPELKDEKVLTVYSDKVKTIKVEL